MANGIRVQFDAIREIAAASILASYTAVGSATDDNARLIRLVNDTDADVYVSIDGTTNHLRIKANSFLLLDMMSNRTAHSTLFLAKGVTFSVKRVSGAPTSGVFFIEVMSAAGGR